MYCEIVNRTCYELCAVTAILYAQAPMVKNNLLLGSFTAVGSFTYCLIWHCTRYVNPFHNKLLVAYSPHCLSINRNSVPKIFTRKDISKVLLNLPAIR